MKIDVYSIAGKKNGTADLPASVFEVNINEGLMHTALVRQQSNRRRPIAHVKTRGEVSGSTRKIFRQKGTGRARRGPIRSPIVRGGGKAFGPRSESNYHKNMTRKARHAAIRSCLSYVAKNDKVLGLDSNSPKGEGFTGKTKDFVALLSKLPVSSGRKIVFVLPEHNDVLERSARNVPGVKTILVQYLNPEDVLGAYSLIFLVDAIRMTEELFGEKKQKSMKKQKNEKSLDSADKSVSSSKKSR